MKDVNAEEFDNLNKSAINIEKKALVQYINSKCRQEQLNILIDRLDDITCNHDILFQRAFDEKPFAEKPDNFYFQKNDIQNEIFMAKEMQKELKKIISKKENIFNE